MKTKIKCFENEGNDFDNKQIPDAGSDYICFALINVDSALKKMKKYYLL